MFNRIPVLSDFMTSNHRRHMVQVTPPLGHIRPKPNPDPTVTRSSPGQRLRVRPQELVHQPDLTRLSAIPVNLFHIVEGDTVFTKQSTVDDKVSFFAVRGEDGWLRSFGFRVRGVLGCRQEGGKGDWARKNVLTIWVWP